jgi:hypothetical protein
MSILRQERAEMDEQTATREQAIECRNCGQGPAITVDLLCAACGYVDGGYHQHPIAGQVRA